MQIVAIIFAALFFLQARADFSITFGGDLNFTQSRAVPSAYGTSKNGNQVDWDELFSGIAPLVNGDLNFANVETVVSDHSDLSDVKEQKFAFRAHPQGLEAAIEHGFNLFSLANNHAGDFGFEGLAETANEVSRLSWGRQVFASGVAINRMEALRPQIIEMQSDIGLVRVAYLAMTGVMRYDYRATATRPGVLSFYDERDFRDAMKSLREAPVDYRILSVHWGKEGTLAVENQQKQMAHRALEEGNVNLILGHHPHRVQPVERVGNRYIFYSLGNFLMIGAANLNGMSQAHDYGLMGKIHLIYSGGALVPSGIEVFPLTNVHFISRPMTGAAAAMRLGILNGLAEEQFKKNGLQFQLFNDHGVNCIDSMCAGAVNVQKVAVAPAVSAVPAASMVPKPLPSEKPKKKKGFFGRFLNP